MKNIKIFITTVALVIIVILGNNLDLSEVKSFIVTNKRNFNYGMKSDKNVDFLLITPCIKDAECYDFKKEILKTAKEYYKKYDIDISFSEQKLLVSRPISIDYGPGTSLLQGFALKLQLIRETGVEQPHIIHGPMFVDQTTEILGVANQYLEIIVLNQSTIDELSTDLEAHVLIHEIGHIFGLEDIYTEGSCNLMNGYAHEETIKCQVLTAEQLEIVNSNIELFLLDN